MDNINKFTKNTLNEQINVSGIYTIHYCKYGRNFKFEGESHNFWELVYLDSGNATILADNSSFKLKQGEAFFHKPNEHHNIFTNDDFANSAIITFECKSRSLKMLSGKVIKFAEYEKSLLNKIINEAKISYNDKLNDLYLTKMTKKNSAPFGAEQIIKNCIELLIISLIRTMNCADTCVNEIGVNTGSDRIVESIHTILQDKLNLASNINLDEISYKLGFSKSYIKSQFKKKTGHSVIQYYIDLKMDKAKKLLSQQKYTISEIADLLGFSSVYYFSRQFKSHTDMSPTEYINSIKADNVL
jgi:AraC-like DNA-binding protein